MLESCFQNRRNLKWTNQNYIKVEIQHSPPPLRRKHSQPGASLCGVCASLLHFAELQIKDGLCGEQSPNPHIQSKRRGFAFTGEKLLKNILAHGECSSSSQCLISYFDMIKLQLHLPGHKTSYDRHIHTPRESPFNPERRSCEHVCAAGT